MKILNSLIEKNIEQHIEDPKIDPCGTPNNISLHELYLPCPVLLFVFYLRSQEDN